MKKEMIILFLVGILFFSPLTFAEEQSQVYSGFDRFADNFKLFFSAEENKVQLALDIREKEVDSAILNLKNNNTKEAEKNLEKAKDNLELIQEKVSLKNSANVTESVQKIQNKVEDEGLLEEFNNYLVYEEKTQLKSELTKKTYEYCKALAKEGYEEMLNEEICNPKTAQEGLQDELKDLKDVQEKLFVQLMLNIRRCIDDPGTCNCDEVLSVDEKIKCEKMVALAVKCEYKEDETSCDELESMEPSPGDGFARSFVPDFLMNLFAEKHTMIEYGINHSDGVPEECWDENDKPECEIYANLKETKLDWDEYGNYRPILYPGKHPSLGGVDEPLPTMQESIPQCFDENDNFLEEKCGKITIVWNEEGLINYLIGSEIDKVIEEFENKSQQHTIEINGTEGRTLVNEIKEEINGLENQIAERTFAEGTYGVGESGQDIKELIVKEEKGVEGDDGFKPEIKTGMGENGDDGLKPEIKTSGNGEGNKESNEDSSQEEIVTNHIDE